MYFLLHPLKTITTGEGGIVTTNSKFLDKKKLRCLDLGIQRLNKNHWQYDVNLSGFNFVPMNFNALWIIQLKKINLFLKKEKVAQNL